VLRDLEAWKLEQCRSRAPHPCVAVCCSVLLCVAVCCSVLRDLEVLKHEQWRSKSPSL